MFPDVSDNILISICWNLVLISPLPHNFFFFDILESYASYIISSSGHKLRDNRMCVTGAHTSC